MLSIGSSRMRLGLDDPAGVSTLAAQMAMARFSADLVEIGAAGRIDHSAPVHHHERVAKFLREIEILLDQHDRHLAKAAQVGDRAADVLDDRGLDALGRLIEQQQARPRHQRAADGKLLLLAAGEVAAAPAQHVAQHRKQREHVIRHAAVGALERRKAGLEILLHRQQRKDLAALRHIGDAAPRPLIRLAGR